MKNESQTSPVLLWTGRTRGDSLYMAARREIHVRTGAMPRAIATEPDISQFFHDNPNAILYVPVFLGDTGWWGGLLGDSHARVVGKIIISAECQLMEIRREIRSEKRETLDNKLLAAEIRPMSGFFRKMTSQIATSLDMLATDSGTILGLFVGAQPRKFINIVESTGNQYLGCVGGY